MKSSSTDGRRELIESALETLSQGEALLSQITDEVYVRQLPGAFNAAIGGHYRHCLDHFRSLLDAATAGDLDYDRRERGTLIESDRFAALNATRALRDSYRDIGETSLDREIHVTSRTSNMTAGSQASLSTVGREIMYVVAHTVHHYALIGIMCGMQGVPIPIGFGVAPSTLKHRAELANAETPEHETDEPVRRARSGRI